MNKPKVSIICNTYNHEKFINQALDSFLMQITNFEYEILVHDDASNDNTQVILKKYEVDYPDKFKIIYQKENQYSKGISINNINVSRSKGEYIAFCEGDDYWIDPYKLQKQTDYLDNNPECKLVVHSCVKTNPNNPFIKKNWIYSSTNRILTTEEIISNRGIIAAHNSFVYRNIELEFPIFFKQLGVWDITRMMYFAIKGYVYYFNEPLSIYRVGISGSWNERVRLNELKLINHYHKEIEFYRSLNMFTKNTYFLEIQRVILDLDYQINLLQKDFETLKLKKYNQYKFSSFSKLFKFELQKYFPVMFRILRFYRYRYWI